MQQNRCACNQSIFLQFFPLCDTVWGGDNMRKNQLKGTLSILFAVLIWGSTFIAQSVGMDHIGPFTFQAIRCGMAVAFLFPLSYLFEKNKPRFSAKWLDPKLWKTGLVCGVALFIAAGLQQMGIVYTSAGKAGFITAMYIVLVPILGLFLKQIPPFTSWISVVLAVIGLYLLSCMGVTEINQGDILLFGCALGYAVQITLIDRMAGSLDGIRLNTIQCLVCSLCSAVVMFLTETPDMGNILACWFPLVYAGILSMGVAYTLQIIGQQHLSPTPASLLMSLESVVALLCGWLLLNETMSVYEMIGCCLVFAAVILSQIPVRKKA